MLVRRMLDKIWNVYWFFVTYANIDQFNPKEHTLAVELRSELDQWILSELQETIREVTNGLEHYDSVKPNEAMQNFLEDLSNWYLRRSRERIWKSEMDDDKVAAYLTLYECLTTLNKLLAPFMPFMTEELYQNLVRSVDPEAPLSVHLCDWPEVNEGLINEQLTNDTHLVMRVVGLGRRRRHFFLDTRVSRFEKPDADERRILRRKTLERGTRAQAYADDREIRCGRG